MLLSLLFPISSSGLSINLSTLVAMQPPKPSADVQGSIAEMSQYMGNITNQLQQVTNQLQGAKNRLQGVPSQLLEDINFLLSVLKNMEEQPSINWNGVAADMDLAAPPPPAARA